MPRPLASGKRCETRGLGQEPNRSPGRAAPCLHAAGMGEPAVKLWRVPEAQLFKRWAARERPPLSPLQPGAVAPPDCPGLRGAADGPPHDQHRRHQAEFGTAVGLGVGKPVRHKPLGRKPVGRPPDVRQGRPGRHFGDGGRARNGQDGQERGPGKTRKGRGRAAHPGTSAMARLLLGPCIAVNFVVFGDSLRHDPGSPDARQTNA